MPQDLTDDSLTLVQVMVRSGNNPDNLLKELLFAINNGIVWYVQQVISWLGPFTAYKIFHKNMEQFSATILQ